MNAINSYSFFAPSSATLDTGAPIPDPAKAQRDALAALRGELDTFAAGVNVTQDGRKLDDIPAKQSRAMLEALVDPATAQRELTQGIIGPNGDLLKPPPEPGSARHQFLTRVAAGEQIPRAEVMKMAEQVKVSTNCSRIVWDMLLSSIIGSLKAEKRVW